jgi:hypothetical protein
MTAANATRDQAFSPGTHNNSMQRTAQRAAAERRRWAAQRVVSGMRDVTPSVGPRAPGNHLISRAE